MARPVSRIFSLKLGIVGIDVEGLGTSTITIDLDEPAEAAKEHVTRELAALLRDAAEHLDRQVEALAARGK